jgi:hypothetical protein
MDMLRPGSMSASDVGSADRQGVTATAYTIGVRDAREALETDVAIAETKIITNEASSIYIKKCEHNKNLP